MSLILYEKYVSKDSPTSVRSSNRTTAGPISGKINENVEARITASIQQAVAYVGSYGLGYSAMN